MKGFTNLFSIIFALSFSFIVSCQMKEPGKQASTFELDEITITQIQDGYKSGKYTVKQIVQLYLKRIEEIDKNGPELNSIIMVNPDALQIAEELDIEIANGNSRGPMHGIPVILKDNINTHDKMPTTGGSRILKDSHPSKDSWVAQKLREAGAVILAKANLSEWANYRADFSSSGWSGVGGQTKNPFVLDRNPCGSSAGSGAAVSANLCAVAIGTETWGSIICPSNNNGVVGIKPTVGLISRSGIIPISYTQDTAGPMSRTVTDAAICLGVLTGIDDSDAKTESSTGHSYKDYTPFLKEDGLKGKRLGFLKDAASVHFKVDTLMKKAVDFLRTQGAEIIELEDFVEEGAGENSEIVLAYEFKDGLRKYFESLENPPVDNLQDAITETLADSIEMQFFNVGVMVNSQSEGDLNSKEYLKAKRDMHLAYQKNGIDKIMAQYNLDAMVAPSGGPAWKTDMINGDNFVLSTSSYAAISGYPSITVPMGFISELPVGLSFFGKEWSEPLLLEIAYAYESATKHRKAPRFIPTN